MAEEQRGALVGGGHGAMIDPFNMRSRPRGTNRCRGHELGKTGAKTLFLLLGSFDSAEDVRANAVVIANLLNGTGLFDLRLHKLMAVLYRWFSLGSAQSTTLLDECVRQHHAYMHEGAEKGAFVDLAEIFFHTGFLAYDEANNIVDGWRMREIRAMAAALNDKSAVGSATIESSLISFFILATGDEKLGQLMAHIIAVCFYGAVGMAVPRVLCGETFQQLCALVFSGDAPTRREELRRAVMGGNSDAVAAEVARFRQFYASIERQVLAAYPYDDTQDLFDTMHGQLLAEGEQQQQNFAYVGQYLEQSGDGCTAFLNVKDPRWDGGEGNKSLEILRVRIDSAEDWSLDGANKGNNSDFLRGAHVLMLVAAHNLATTRDLEAPLLAHLDEYGGCCQAMTNAYHLFGTGHTRLWGQTQADCIIILDNGELLHSERRGEARIREDWHVLASKKGYGDDVKGVLSMLADPANSVDALRMRCIADTTPVDEETGRASGFLAGVAHFSANFKSRRNEVMAPRPFQLPGGEVPWGGDEKQDRNFRPGQVGAFLVAYPEANALPSDDEKEEEESVD